MIETTAVVRIRALSVFSVPAMLLAAAWPTLAAERQSEPEADLPQAPSGTREFHVLDPQLASLIEELLVGNPELRAAREFSLSQSQRARQESALPDPEFEYRLFLSNPETRVGPQEQSLRISQELPWFGKRGLQGERADHTATGVSWRARSLERERVAELKRAYFDAAYLQEALAVNADEGALLRRFEQIALTRYAVGEGVQQSAIRVQTDISRLTEREIALTQELDAIERRITELVGRPGTDRKLLPISLPLPDLRPDRIAIETASTESNPAVSAGQKQIEADDAWVRRRRRDAYPDFTVGLGYTDVGRRQDTAGVAFPPEDNGKDIWAVSVRVNIPLQRGRIRAGIAEAEHGRSASRHALRRTQDRLISAAQESLRRMESVDERARLYRDLIIPQANESLASAEAAYTTNRQSFFDLLDAERVLFQARLTYHRLLADLWIALTDVEQATGSPFPNDEATP